MSAPSTSVRSRRALMIAAINKGAESPALMKLSRHVMVKDRL